MTENAQPPADNGNAAPVDDIDATLDAEVNPDASQPSAMNLDGANDAGPSAPNGVVDAELPFEPRIPAKKDATLREFLGKMDDYAPIVCHPSESAVAAAVQLTSIRSQMP
jgi:transcription initiation factor TFIID subunit 10